MTLRVVVSGLIAQYPLGGITWHYLQYVLGLARLGHDVYYFEDTGQYPYDPGERGLGKDCSYNVEYLAAVMRRFGLEDRWAYRFPFHSRWFGLSEERRRDVLASADLLLNVSGVLERPAEYRPVRRLAYVDTDPVFTQIKLLRGQRDFQKIVDLHDVHFTFGECLDEALRATGHDWQPTRQPVVLSEWDPAPERRDVYTTVMNWTSYKPVVHGNRTYGQKDVEFERFLELPSRVPAVELEIAVNAGKTRRTPRELLAHRGWRVVDPAEVCADLDGYRSYIATSKAEWSVAKGGYVVGQAGWFSDRSACYLASGRPVILQDTGFARVLPTGSGLLAFRTLEEAVQAIAAVEADYARHSRAARELAESHFDARKVLARLLDGALG